MNSAFMSVLRELKQGNSAMAISRKICNGYGQRVITGWEVGNCFAVFRSGDTSLEDESRKCLSSKDVSSSKFNVDL